jgi:hypothetical protein
MPSHYTLTPVFAKSCRCPLTRPTWPLSPLTSSSLQIHFNNILAFVSCVLHFPLPYVLHVLSIYRLHLTTLRITGKNYETLNRLLSLCPLSCKYSLRRRVLNNGPSTSQKTCAVFTEETAVCCGKYYGIVGQNANFLDV